MKELVVKVLEKNLESIGRLENDIENGGNKKSIESLICGIKKNNEILRVIKDLLDGKKDFDKKIIERLEYNRKVVLKEVSKEDVIKNDWLDKVIIKKVNGVNKYFISE